MAKCLENIKNDHKRKHFFLHNSKTLLRYKKLGHWYTSNIKLH